MKTAGKFWIDATEFLVVFDLCVDGIAEKFVSVLQYSKKKYETARLNQ